MSGHTKQITVGYPRGKQAVKIVFPGGAVYVQTSLVTNDGKPVTYVSVDADGDRFAGEPESWARWGTVSKKGGACRIVTEKPEVSNA
jgi:hypothetical protein